MPCGKGKKKRPTRPSKKRKIDIFMPVKWASKSELEDICPKQ